MGQMLDFIKRVMEDGGLRHNADSLGEMMPPELGKPDNSILGPGLVAKNQKLQDCPQCIYNDAGDIVDYNYDKTGKPKDAGTSVRDIIGGKPGGEGTLRGFLDRMLSPTPERNAPNQVQGTGTVGGGSGGVPGEGVDPGLDPTLTKDQKVPAFKRSGDYIPTPNPRPQAAPPADYSMPLMDPTSIEQLRTSLLTQAGQMDPNNPNGLAGRMNSPLAPSDIGQQQNEAMGISDRLRGHDGVKKAQIKVFNEGK